MDNDLPKHVNFWITTTSKHDCFFNVGPESGPKERIGAIKILLISHSEVFQKMLDESPLAEKGDIPVVDSDPETFMNFLKCIYGGTDIVVRKLCYEKCMSLLYLCEKYLALEIKENIISLILQLYNPLSIDQVMISLSNPACITNSGRLTNAISKLIQNNTDKILNHKSFLDLDSNAVEFISKHDRISTEEVNLWKAMLKWAKEKVGCEDPKAVRSQLEHVIKHIRFCAMEGNEFCKSVVPCKVLTMEEVFEINMSIGTQNPLKLDGLCSQILNRKKNQTLELTFTSVYNLKNFTGSENSPKYKLGEFDWCIEVKKNEGNKLGVYVCCSSGDKEKWKCYANYTLELVNCMNGKPNLIRSTLGLSQVFTNNNGWFGSLGFRSGVNDFISFKDLMNIEMGYVKNNAIEIITTVELI